MSLTENSITFGKYKGQTIDIVLKDRKYCSWLLTKDWFQKNYEYLYNRIQEYNPLPFFLTKPILVPTLDISLDTFLNEYHLFYLKPVEDLPITLTDIEETCYSYYLKLLVNIKSKINEQAINPYNIKAPVRWLQVFEQENKEQNINITRDDFKNFINSYELPNIPYIIETIKKLGGIEYKGARSFLLAKKKSIQQEEWWEELLKEKYGEDVASQFKYEQCIFDFLHINLNTIYECKLNIKDFNEEQYRKYLLTLGKYSIIYLINRDCIIDIENRTIYTLNKEKYKKYITTHFKTKFDRLIMEFEIEGLVDLEELKDYL